MPEPGMACEEVFKKLGDELGPAVRWCLARHIVANDQKIRGDETK